MSIKQLRETRAKPDSLPCKATGKSRRETPWQFLRLRLAKLSGTLMWYPLDFSDTVFRHAARSGALRSSSKSR
jgi:hypothetical protein